MTQLLEEAIEAIKQLPASEQDSIAARLLQELADDRRWDEAFSKSEDRLSQIVAEVRAEIKAGKVKPMKLEDL